ncbi:hypothetical protein O2K51_04240 [Apibacter raozihei]|uniref:hypothetical protein n=1 Tax=Apibacter raozihei TaxID=2500547 RepID=UPI000FE43DF2|nr:hypothetical protein [Apibacter raozihei]
MMLQVKPFWKNLYPKTGILIINSSPYAWLKEIEMMEIDLEKTLVYAIPSDKANVLYGCFLILKDYIPREAGKNLYYQCINNKLFIPEYSIINPQICDEDQIVLTSDFYIMSPEFGLVELREIIDWTTIIQAENINQNIKILKPESGIRAPSKINEYILEIDENKFLEELTEPKTEKEWIKDLPFNLKKVLAGNHKEFQKYLNYIEKHPNRAVDLGVPLDVTYSSRGDSWASYTFNKPFFESFSQNINKLSNGPYRWTLYLLGFILIKCCVIFIFHPDKKNNSTSKENVWVYPTTSMLSKTEIFKTLDSIYGYQKQIIDKNLQEISTDKSNKSSNQKDLNTSDIREISDLKMDKIKLSYDSLVEIYNKKIENYISIKSNHYLILIRDSLQHVNPYHSITTEQINTIWNKKSSLIRDSLEQKYGIIPKSTFTSDFTAEKPKKTIDRNTSFIEIFSLSIFLLCLSSFYLFIFKNKSVNFGGNKISFVTKLILLIFLLGTIIYLLYPLIENFGYNWFTYIIIFCCFLILLRLFDENKNILNADDEK